MTRKRKSSIMIIAMLIVSLLVPSIVGAVESNGKSSYALDQKIVSRISITNAMEHIRHFSEEIGPRPAGLPNEKIAANYIANYFTSLGYETEIHDFSISGGNANVNVGYITFEDGTIWETGSAAGGLSASGPLFHADTGAPDQYPADLEPGFVALVKRGLAFNTIAANAKAAGAVGVIIYNTTFGGRGNYPAAFSPSASTDIPVMGAAWIHGVRMIEMVETGETIVSLSTIRYTSRKSQNVIATKPAKNGDPNAPIIAVTAHYDTVVGSPGANDNASGVAFVMEMARIMKSYNTDKEIRFIAFGAEEVGLTGATRYVAQLSEAEKERFKAGGVFNADMIGTNHPNVTHLVAATPNGVRHIVTDSAAAAGARLGDSTLMPTTFGSSDHVPFHNAGIPAALFIWLGGGLVPSNYEVELFYHTPQDTIEENMCETRYLGAMRIIGAAVFDVARKEIPALKNSNTRIQ